MKVMIGNAARGGMRSVVEAYERDGFLARENVRLINAYCDGGFVKRQIMLLRALVAFLACLLSSRVELVHCHAAMRGSFWRKSIFAVLARRFGVPVLLHLHGSEMKSFYGNQKPVVQTLIRRQLEKATAVIVLSESWREFVASIAPQARISVVPNYVSLPIDPAPEGKDANGVLFLGLVGPRKGTFDLIESFAAVRQTVSAAHLTIGGNGEIEKASDLIRRMGLQPAVDMAGWVGSEQRAQLLSRNAIYVLPSYNEGLPMSVLEAMAAGLAVVTTRVGGIPELVTDGADGLLVAPGDKAALSAALIRLLTDDEFRILIAAAGRRRVADSYSDGVVLPMLHALYASCSR